MHRVSTYVVYYELRLQRTVPTSHFVFFLISCLDRTNVAQFSTGVEAIGQQLVVMGIRSRARLESTSSIVRVLIDSKFSVYCVLSMIKNVL